MSIPLDHECVRRAMSIIPAAYHSRVWIAGSAASPLSTTAWEAGGDVDVWITGQRDAGAIRTVVMAAGHVPDAPTYDTSRFHIPYSHDRLQILMPYGGEEIAEVVGEFDISCHAWARHILTDVELEAPGATVAIVRVLRWHSAVGTAFRALKFMMRYHEFSGLREDPKLAELLALMVGRHWVGREDKELLKMLRLKSGL